MFFVLVKTVSERKEVIMENTITRKVRKLLPYDLSMAAKHQQEKQIIAECYHLVTLSPEQNL